MFSIFGKSTVNSIGVNDLDKLSGKINLIDIREPFEYKSGHLPLAKNIPMAQILEMPEKYLKKDEEYHIICQSGARSSRTCSKLKAAGYKVINVEGGTGGYAGKLKK